MREAKQTKPAAVKETENEIQNELSCSEVKEVLDELFGAKRKLEETRPHVKHHLFVHLEACRKCCRAFDVRVRFRPSRRGGIY